MYTFDRINYVQHNDTFVPINNVITLVLEK